MLGKFALRAETCWYMFCIFSLGLPSVLQLLKSEVLSVVAACLFIFQFILQAENSLG
jgi:hypothetical protein